MPSPCGSQKTLELRRPMAARIAMTIAHADRCAGHGELDRPTEATSIVGFWTGHIGFLIDFRTLGDGYYSPTQQLSKTAGTNVIRARSISAAPSDLPLNFHPAAFRASTNVTPFGAVSVPA